MPPPPCRPRLARLALALLALVPAAASLSGCADEPDVVVYCALDQVFSEPLLQRFERESGLVVRMEFDVEADKTVGLVRRIQEERARPRCDVFWNNEPAQTVRLAEEGLLASYESPSARDVPALFRDPQGRWTGFAARARVFIVNTELADPSTIHGMADLLDPRWKGQVAMARPLTGTTLSHAAALYQVLGDAPARAYLEQVHAASRAGELELTGGNAHVMRLVSSGQAAWGWTDTDDYNVARENGAPVTMVVPDQEPGGIGTLLLPNTLSILAAAPHPQAARTLVDWLLRPEIEAELARSRSAQIPVRDAVPRPPHVLRDFHAMEVDFGALGKQIAERSKEFAELFLE